MKTLKNLVSVFSLALLMLITFNVKAQQKLTPDEYGQYHNLGLDLFYQENPNYKFSDFNKLMTDLATTFHRHYPTVFIEEVDYSLANVIFKKENLTFKEIMNQSSVNLSAKIKSLVSTLIEKQPLITETNKIIDDFIKNNSLTVIEKEKLLNFKAVCNYSNTYWSEKNPSPSSSANKWKCTPQAQQYLADGFGALFFGGLGAVGYSWAIHEFQQNNGGGCI